MKLVINGESRELPGISTIGDVLAAFKLQQKILVVELNRFIVDREQYGSTPVREGDSLEIVHFVGGG